MLSVISLEENNELEFSVVDPTCFFEWFQILEWDIHVKSIPIIKLLKMQVKDKILVVLFMRDNLFIKI